jgi:hypothetical protein
VKVRTLTIVQIGAILLFLVGAAWTAATFRQSAAMRRKITGKLEILAQLQDQRQIRDRQQAALHAWETAATIEPAPLAGLAASVLTNATPEIRERESRGLIEGWTLRQLEVVLNEINLNQLPAFLHAAEQARPPWRMAECTITSSRQTDGVGRVVLIVETLTHGGKHAAEDKGQAPDAGRQRADDK